MLDIFLYPDATRNNLRVLDNFIQWVSQSSLPSHTKEDAIKILESLRWVKTNLSQIKEFVNHKDNHLPLLPDSDRIKGAVRDHLGTSLHFNSYESGEKAERDLQTLIDVFESTFTSLTQPGAENPLALLIFVAKCNYDKDRGCLEARVANAMIFAGVLKESNNLLSLNDLLLICQSLYFINTENISHNFIMAEQFLSPLYQQPILDEKGQRVLLTQELVFNAMENILCYPRPSPDTFQAESDLYKSDFPSFQAKIFLSLTKHATQAIGKAGMLQYRYDSKEEADQLSIWLKRCDSLKSHHIHRCRVIEEQRNGKIEYVVRLTQNQKNIIGSLHTQTSLLEKYQFTDTHPEGPGWAREFFVMGDSLAKFIDSALITQDKNNDTLLSWSARYQDSTAFQALINTASREAISQALTIKNDYGVTPLSWAAAKQDSAAFQALINKASSEAINQALIIKNNNGDTPLSWAAEKQDSTAFQALLNKASSEAINQALIIKNNSGLTPLTVAAKKQNSAAFQALLNKASSEAINQALLIKDNKGIIPLSWAAVHQDSTAFQALINKASSEAINQALIIKNIHGETSLLVAAVHQDSAAFQALLNKASSEAINQALTIKDDNGDTPLSLAAAEQDSAAFQALINKASSEAINQALLIKDNNGDTPLLLAARYQDSAAFQALIHKASSEAINQALLIKNNNGDTPLSWAAAKQDSAAFQALLNKASSEAINQALMIKNNNGNTPLTLAAKKQDSAAFQALVNKASTEAISQVWLIKNHLGNTPFSRAALDQDSAAFQTLIKKLPSETLNQGLVIKDNSGETVLHVIAEKHDKTSLLILINRATPETLFKALSSDGDSDRFMGRIACIVKEIKDQEELATWVILLFKMSGRIKNWPKGVFFGDERTFLAQSATLNAEPYKSIAKVLAQQFAHLAHPNTKPNNDVIISIGETTYTLNPQSPKEELTDLLTDIQSHGFGSWVNYYLLQNFKKTHAQGNIFDMVCMEVNTYGVLDAPKILNEQNDQSTSKICNEGHLAMKMFSGWQPQAWSQFLEQLEKTTLRAPLRKPRNPPKETHKLDLLTGEIDVYQGKDKHPKLHHATHAKKQSATLISTQRVTPLFQSHDLTKPLVGVAIHVDPDLRTEKSERKKGEPTEGKPPCYKEDLAKIKAMMLYDTGTYNRNWVGTENEVRNYAAKVKSYPSLQAFHAAIAQEKSRTNEIFVEPSKSSLLAIVIGRDAPTERKLAYEYQKNVKDELGIELPIVLYDANKQLLIPLDKHDAMLKYAILVKEKNSLLLQKVSNHRKSFFNSKTEVYQNGIYPTGVVKKLSEIDKALEGMKKQFHPPSRPFNRA